MRVCLWLKWPFSTATFICRVRICHNNNNNNNDDCIYIPLLKTQHKHNTNCFRVQIKSILSVLIKADRHRISHTDRHACMVVKSPLVLKSQRGTVRRLWLDHLRGLRSSAETCPYEPDKLITEFYSGFWISLEASEQIRNGVMMSCHHGAKPLRNV